MNVAEKVEGNWIVLQNDKGITLELPRNAWGSPDVRVNGNQVPSAKIWGLIGSCRAEGKKVPRSTLMEEARKAEIYRQLDTHMLVWTRTPHESDEPVDASKNVYMRKEKQRIRPLVHDLDIKIAKIDVQPTPGMVKDLHDVCATIGLYPVGAGDDRVLYSKNPQAVFDAFGSKDFVRIMVYCRRPGSSSVSLDLTGL